MASHMQTAWQPDEALWPWHCIVTEYNIFVLKTDSTLMLAPAAAAAAWAWLTNVFLVAASAAVKAVA